MLWLWPALERLLEWLLLVGDALGFGEGVCLCWGWLLGYQEKKEQRCAAE
jgi:hypothetical protein